MSSSFIKHYVASIKGGLVSYLACNKFATTKVYYKSELFTCTSLSFPVVVFTLESKGEVVSKCRAFSLSITLDFTIITDCSSCSTQGLTLALLVTKFLAKNYFLSNFSINDSSVAGEEEAEMITKLRCAIADRINSCDLNFLC
ncbi:hypothetical protein F0310_04375 (plasmid) [Borrelia sp. A-FGy1]|uniref:hypothetical protein n=1 Tax=Borrelia sp. A-FGy1 TaxID=2608247 RepID=UPI0015F61B16|nr:hypothetical protein [Borrelia sp. A-FGy1]QMU99653.1 hypothetical protein F0310_04375 [Borrelia sp. A-FGy1]